MAYDYKTIGKTAAKVVTIFATAGGLLWFARDGSNKHPQSQDEAEIMAGCLERKKAMVDTNYAFTDTWPGLSNIVIAGVYSNLFVTNYTFRFVSDLKTNVGGTNYSVIWYTDSAGGTYYNRYCAFTDQTAIVLSDTNTASGILPTVNLGVLTHPDGASLCAPQSAEIYEQYPTRQYEILCGEGGILQGHWRTPSGDFTNPNDALPEQEYPNQFPTGIVTITYSPNYGTNYPERRVTNLLDSAHVDTNTIYGVPNATKKYPPVIRSLIVTNGEILGDMVWQWMLPSNVFMRTGDWDGSWAGHTSSVIRTLSDSTWWTNWVTYPTATVYTSAVYHAIIDVVTTIVSVAYFTNLVSVEITEITPPATAPRPWSSFPVTFTFNVSWPGTYQVSKGDLPTYLTRLNVATNSTRIGNLVDPNLWTWRGAGMPCDLLAYDIHGVYNPTQGVYHAEPTFSSWATTNLSIKTNWALSTQHVFQVNYATNTWLDRSFAFERDKKPLYWSTNAYNDMGRALAMMQWIKPDWLFWESAPTNYTLGVDYTDTTNGVWNGNYLGGEWVGGSGSVSDSGAELTITVSVDMHTSAAVPGQSGRESAGVGCYDYWGDGPTASYPEFDYQIQLQGSIRGRRPYMYINPPGKVFDMTNFMLYADNLVYNFTTNMLPGNPTAQPNRTNGYLTAVAVDAQITNNYYVYGEYLWNPTNLPPSTNWIQSVLSGIDWAGIYANNVTTWTNFCVEKTGNPYLSWGSYYTDCASVRFASSYIYRYGWKSSDSGYGSARFQFQTFTNFTNYLPIR